MRGSLAIKTKSLIYFTFSTMALKASGLFMARSNYGWEAVKDSVTKIGIFGAMDTEVWVDDIEIFGYGIFDPYAPVVKKSVVRKEE